MRERAGGKQRPADAERAEFGKSLSDAERNQIELRIQQLLGENPTLSPANARPPGVEDRAASVPFEVLDEYFFCGK